MSNHLKRLRLLAEREVQRTLAELPPQLRVRAEAVPLVYDGRDADALEADGVGETLGLFVGENFVESGLSAGGLPAQIILYLVNLWFEADDDEDLFLREVRTTYLHELGHFLGLEEIDLDERGL